MGISSSRRTGTRREVSEIRRRLRAMSNPEAAKLAKSATRSPLSFLGILPPQLRTLARELARRHRPRRSLEALLSTAGQLLKSRWHEERSVAIQMVAVLARRLQPEDWNRLKGWIRSVRSADHCDGIAVDLLGSLVKRDRSWCRVLKHWTLSPRVWERRAAVMAVFLRTRLMGDVEAAFSICEALMEDEAPEVREAVVIVLLEAGAFDPDLTRAFLDRWKGKASPGLLETLSRD